MSPNTIPLAPEQASNFALEHDLLFYTLTGLTILFTAIVGIMILVFVVRYHENNKKVDRSKPQHHNLPLELTWSIIPMCLGLGVFGWSTILYMKMRKPPTDALDIYVVGKQWMWQIQHPNGVRENNELHVPLGKPVRLTMISQDVIHALWLPAQRVQKHVEPGRYTSMWFTPTKPGKYHMFCSMHCGTQHSEMGGYVYVLEPEKYEAWLENSGNKLDPVKRSMVVAGKKLFKDYACVNCHKDKDSPRAPSLMGLIGKPRQMSDGRIRVADEEYLRESIRYPAKNIVAGYDIMPSYGQLNEDQILQLIAYIKSLSKTEIISDDIKVVKKEGNKTVASKDKKNRKRA